ncbi:MAG TPA: erythromycin esterase family protein, partial [Thermomicrobiales bacterium]|nr:erythromycin esterase family protein [Thermomicrobiales bacterium]
DFYRVRAEITRRLIEERGFDAIAAEADWPDAFRINRYVRHASDDTSARNSLGDFRRFPQWTWRNTVVLDFVRWLRDYNDAHAAAKTGFYGLDLYSLTASMEAVVAYLDKVDPEAANRARARYSCFDHFGQDPQSYGLATSYGAAEPCEDAVVEQLIELHTHAAQLAMQDGMAAEDEFFSAQQNARLAKNAEEYYRAMFRGRISSWNLRDMHMAETMDALLDYLTKRNNHPAKLVVWAHNSHLGDARATEMSAVGELNLGQLARTRHTGSAFLIGQTTYDGTVTAASDWDEPAQRKTVQPGLPGSYENLFHDVEVDSFMLSLRQHGETVPDQSLERAIGVIYRPETERASHYFEARLARQFDVILHHDRTTALTPLDPLPEDSEHEAPETFPTGDVPPR